MPLLALKCSRTSGVFEKCVVPKAGVSSRCTEVDPELLGKWHINIDPNSMSKGMHQASQLS